MKSITAQFGQTIFDISLQELGSIEGVFDLLEANPGLQLDMAVSVGTNVKKPTPVIDLRVAEYYSRNGITPVSDVVE
jgi:hypothetical protein